MAQVKTCANPYCATPFYRKPDISQQRWQARKYCSQRCGLSDAGRGDFHTDGAVSAESARNKAGEIGSAALRRLIIDMFARTANRHHVSLDQAAKMHLCPAPVQYPRAG